MVEYQFCATLGCVAAWVREFQGLVAGCLAILAALIAYQGALRQARAPLLAADRLRSYQRQAAAAALWSELTACHIQLVADRRKLRATRVKVSTMLPIHPFGTPVFDSQPHAVGLLPPDEA